MNTSTLEQNCIDTVEFLRSQGITDPDKIRFACDVLFTLIMKEAQAGRASQSEVNRFCKVYAKAAFEQQYSMMDALKGRDAKRRIPARQA